MRLVYLPAVLGVAGCDSDGDGLINERRWGTDPSNPDSDGDRLLDGDEVLLGLDPASADSDGDGYEDGDELLEGTDPLDAQSRIYTGGWPYLYDKDRIENPGFDGSNAFGSIAPRLVGLDQYGEKVDLYDFAFQGKDIFIDVCGSYKRDCYVMADWRANGDAWRQEGPFYSQWTGALDKLNNGDAFWITVLTHGSQWILDERGDIIGGESATAADVMTYAETYPHPLVPVLLDDDQKFWRWASQTQSWRRVPTFVWLAEDLRLKRTDRDEDPFAFYTLPVFANSRN